MILNRSGKKLYRCALRCASAGTAVADQSLPTDRSVPLVALAALSAASIMVLRGEGNIYQ